MTELQQLMPQWLNSVLFRRAIRDFKNDNTIEIKSFKINPVSGENFASKIFRSTIEFGSSQSEINQCLNVVIKFEAESDESLANYLEQTSQLPMFETETDMYKSVIPKMHALYQQNGIDVKFAPQLIYAECEPHKIVIVEDLTPEGYRIFQNPPNTIEESTIIIQRLAQFHAASIYLSDNSTIDFTKFKHSAFESQLIIDLFFRNTLQIFYEVVEAWEGFESYLPKLKYQIENVGKIGIKSYTANSRDCGFNVLNHGDFQLRNILIKADAYNRIEDVSLIDYQLSVWCSPVVDLTFLAFTRVPKLNDIDEQKSIMIYHQELASALKAIGYMKAPPSLIDVNLELLKHGAFRIALWICFYPVMFFGWKYLMEPESDSSRSFKRSIYNTSPLKEILQQEMSVWEYKGWW